MKIKPKDQIEWTLREMGIPYVKELMFAKPRRWRFDYAIPDKMIAIEYEGGMGTFSGKSRHTTKEGYTGDLQKYNRAVVMGWKVLRYGAKNVGYLREDLMKIINDSA